MQEFLQRLKELQGEQSPESFAKTLCLQFNRQVISGQQLRRWYAKKQSPNALTVLKFQGIIEPEIILKALTDILERGHTTQATRAKTV